MNIGKRIKKAREERNKTLLEVANALGVTEATAQRYESGNIKNLKLDTISKLAEFLKVDPAYLMGWKEAKEDFKISSKYRYYPVGISAGLPLCVDGIQEGELETISIQDNIMGKWAGRSDIFMMRVNGDSMNKVIPHGSLIGVNPIPLEEIKNGDIVVYSDGGDYAVKRFHQRENKIIFRPDSTDDMFSDYETTTDNAELKIHGKVVMYLVELD
ncbi:helix-turn-helix domain-containing protein [Siminovitchia terrae]|uniref:Helix-turn-helix domain-containing protein n=1 Tax=Siminovitchia terrae TaxID=1914933 RepID=A0A429X8B0_SIMTE|nr:XRE family transcriptional regulator [Siminovitchia terrae]RST59678.1 helix-turn-helix domain-containing protein [Siminovitchia terrae]